MNSPVYGSGDLEKQKGETLYSLRCIPIGGYCAMEGEDGDSDNPRAFSRAKVWKRLIILVAGSFMNLVAGLLIMTIYVASVYQAIPTRAVASVDSASVFAGQLQAGDSFIPSAASASHRRATSRCCSTAARAARRTSWCCAAAKKVRLPNAQVERRDFGGEQLYGFTIDVQEKTLGGTLGFSWNSCVDFVHIVRLGLGDLFTGPRGPEGYERTGRHRRAGHGDGQPAGERLGGAGCRAVLLLLHRHQPRCDEPAAHPALDGGRIVGLLLTTLIERITRKMLNPKYEAWINGVGMVLLLLLIAVITFKDIFHLFT